METAATTEVTGTSEAAAQPLETAPEQGVNWEDVVSGGDDGEADFLDVEGDVEVLPESATATEGAQPTVAEPAPAVTPTTEQGKPEVKPEEGKPEVPTTQFEIPPVDQAATFDVVAWEKEQLTKLEDSYKLSEEDAQAFLTEPETTLPKLAAAMHLRLTKSILGAVQGMIPQIMAMQQSAAATETEAKTAFFSVNEDLNKPEYTAAIMEVGKMFRSVNPNAPKEEAIKKIGELARVALGLPQPGAVAPTASTAPAVPQQSVRPYTPSRGGGGAAAPVVPKNEWADLVAGDDD